MSRGREIWIWLCGMIVAGILAVLGAIYLVHFSFTARHERPSGAAGRREAIAKVIVRSAPRALAQAGGTMSIVSGLCRGDSLEACHGEAAGRQHVIAVTLLDLQNLIDLPTVRKSVAKVSSMHRTKRVMRSHDSPESGRELA
jgi:hypothetical protein